MPIKPEHLDELLAGYEKPEDLLGEDGLFKQLKKALLERALGAELTHHLGYEKGDPVGRGTGNNRNGSYAKTVLTEDGSVEIDVPRDRNGSFEPQIVAKGESRLDGFDDKIISLYARGMTVREIQGHLRELYAVDVSPDLISRVTDAVLDEVREWQNRPLDTVYPVVFFDALRVKIRDESVVRNKAVYLALALDCEGHKHVLGLWIEQSEGAKFWLRVMNELKNRGVEDIIFAVVDGLKGFPDAITATFPRTTVQTCIRPSDQEQSELRVLAGPQAAPAGTAGDLPGRDGRGGRAAARRLRSRVGQEVSRHRSGLATSLDRGHPILRLSAADQEDDPHHQRHRESASRPAQDHQDPRRLPVGRSRHQTTLSGAEESRRSLEACHRVARRLRPVRHLLCRAFAYYNPLITTRHGTLAHS